MKLLKPLTWTPRFRLLIGMALLAFSGCYDDPPLADESNGGKANGGKGSVSDGGDGLSSGATGASSVGGAGGEEDGGEGVGGSGGNGGSGGATPTGGKAGMGGKADMGGKGGTGGEPVGSMCGNMTVDAGEECDDGNTKNGDGCSSQCKEKCEACEATYCDFGDFGDIEAMCFTLGANDTALEGPALGAPRSKLCMELVECVRVSGCMHDALTTNPYTGSPFEDCFCGPGIDCVGTTQPPEGPCVAEFQRAAETETSSAVGARLPDFAGANYPELGLAVGRASVVLQYCDLNACSRECYMGKDSDVCSRCALGPDASQSYEPGQAATCGTSAVVCDHVDSCASVVACVRQTKCAASTIHDCYANGTGPCADQVEAAAGPTAPGEEVEEVNARLVPNGASKELSLAVQLVTCMKSSCSAECFP